jgi:hypothetical protein
VDQEDQMAEINVERKGPSGWLWILGILAAVGFVWVLVAMSRSDNFDETTAAAPEAVPAAPVRDVAPTTGVADARAPEVAAFLTFTEAPGGSPTGPAHDYAADGIRRLTGALNAVIEKGTVAGNAVQDQFKAFQTKADRIQADPQATGHADQVRDVFTSAASLMSAVQEDKWPDAADLKTRIAEARRAAEDIEAERSLLDQTAKVKAFFNRAAAALRAMPVSSAAQG